MKLFFALACAAVLASCSQSSDVQSGAGNSVGSANSQSSTDAPTKPHGVAETTGSPASQGGDSTTAAVPADPTEPKDRKPKDGDEVAVMETSKGRIVLMFFPDKAPKTVENFKKLARKGFYDGTKFHRVIPGFMIQGGDPNTKSGDPGTWGMGGPGYTIPDEFSDVDHVPGILSMANTGSPNSGGSQFFIMVAPYPSLNGKYSAFGKVVSGQKVADDIVQSPRGENDRPNNPPVIKSLKIVKWPIK